MSGPPSTRPARSSAGSCRRTSAPGWCTPASRSPGWPPRGPAWRTCSSSSPVRVSMSTAEVTGTQPDPAARAAGPVGPVIHWIRFLRSELSLIFLRWRNLALLAVLAAIPVLIGVALKLSTGGGRGDGQGPAFIAEVAGKGGNGTLRYLLTVPAGRTRLLGIKYTALVIFCLAACAVVTVSALVIGAALFPLGPVTLLSGTTISLGAGLLRLAFVALYVAGALAALAAIGLAISTFTEHPIGAIAAIMVLALASEVSDSVPQFAVVHPYLPTHWWLSFDALLRSPIAWPDLMHGLLSFGIYVVIFGAIAWARFTTADVTS